MLKKLLCLFLLLKLSQARYGFVPKFYGQDSAIIVDTDKALPPSNAVSLNYPTKFRLPPPFPMWQHFPRYHIIPAPPTGQILPLNAWPKSNIKSSATQSSSSTTSSTTTTHTSTTTTTTAKPNTTPTTTTTTTQPPTTTNSLSKLPSLDSKFDIDTVPFVTDDEYPRELLDIAQNKLGLKRLNEVPSISELGQLLGTNSPQETLKYIKQLTSNEQGVALMKAYIESTDYTDNSGDLDTNNEDNSDDYTDDVSDRMGDIEEPLQINDEGLVVVSDEDSNDDYEIENDNAKHEEQVMKEDQIQTTTTTLKPRKKPKIKSKLKDLSADKEGFFERIAHYMHLNNLWQKSGQTMMQQNDDNPKEDTSSELNELKRVTFLGKKVESSLTEPTQTDILEDSNTNLPLLVRDPIPFNYPVPLRAQTSETTTSTLAPETTTTTSSTPHSSSVHLNTPKMLIPHVQQLARVTKISPQKIEDFLATKPKLLALANKVSRFPIGYDRNSPMEAQVMMAVQRAIEQDDDLKKLLNSTATLK